MRTAEDNAREFGALSKQGKDVRLALLVACSVAPGDGEGNRRDRASSGKISARAFALLADTTKDRVLRHLAAWDAVAARDLVTASAALTPEDGDVYPTLSEEAIRAFHDSFDASRSGGRPRASMREIVERASVDRMYARELRRELDHVIHDQIEDRHPSAPKSPAPNVHLMVLELAADAKALRADLEQLIGHLQAAQANGSTEGLPDSAREITHMILTRCRAGLDFAEAIVNGRSIEAELADWAEDMGK